MTNDQPKERIDVHGELAQAARIMDRYARMLPNDREPTPEERAAAVATIREWMDESDVTIGVLARQLGRGFSRPVLSATLGLTYKGDLDDKLRRILGHIGHQESDRNALQPAGLVETEAVRRFMSTVKHTRATKGIGLILAPAGFSKTAVLEYVSDTHAGAVLITATVCCHTTRQVVMAIAKALGLTAKQQTDEAWRAIGNQIKGTGRLILVDQAHLIDPEALKVFWHLNDIGVPIVLAGTKDLNLKMDDTKAGAQLYSRVTFVCDLNDVLTPTDGGKPRPIHSVDEIKKICGAEALRLTGDAEQLLHNMGNSPGAGGLRLVKSILQALAQIPKYRVEAISAAVIWHALVQLRGGRYKGVAALEVKKTQERMSKVKAG